MCPMCLCVVKKSPCYFLLVTKLEIESRLKRLNLERGKVVLIEI
jgi:hypothetical protein